MKEIQTILEKAKNLSAGEKAILATVVDVAGSGYRRPGARMLIDENGYSVGTVSGGCLEADVLERAKKVLETDEPIVITYDTTQDENSVFGLSMGCRGIVKILLESVTKTSDFFTFVADDTEMREPFVVATLIESKNSEFKVGGRILFDNYGIHSSSLGGEIDEFLATVVRRAFANQKSTHETFNFGEVFIEYIEPPVSLLLFGTGFDALPLIKFAKEIGWRVTAIDHRPAFANKERLPNADETIVSSSEDLNDEIFQDENSVAVIMTHNYERDRNILRRLLHSKCKYIGALGPKKRTEKLLEEIGEIFSAEQLAKLHAPVGLDIGADSPESIALSIVSEIQSVLSNRAGGFLRERKGSIYARD